MSTTLLNTMALRAAGLAAVLAIGGCSNGNNNSAIEGPLIPPPPQTSADYELVWSDEFDGAELDSANWTVQVGNGAEAGIPGWGNNELQYYTADNISVTDGNLVIEARSGDSPDPAFAYTSGRINSEGKVDFTFGRLEASIKVPPGVGLWAAFWMLGTDPSPYGIWAAKGEIDILESYGGDTPFASAALHYGMQDPEGQYIFKENRDVDPTDGFHQYAVEWDVEQIRFYIDGVHFYTVRAESYWNYYYAGRDTGFQAGGSAAPFDADQYILLNLAVGGNLPGFDVDPAALPGQMLVDYVRLYQCPIDPQNTGLGCQNSIDPVNPYIIAEVEEDDVFTAGYDLYLDGTGVLFEGTGAERPIAIEVFENDGAMMVTEVTTADGGMAIEARSSGSGNFSLKAADGGTFNLFGMGDAIDGAIRGGEIKFNILLFSGADTDTGGVLQVRMDSGFPDVAYVEVPLSSIPLDEWTTVALPISDILQSNQGAFNGAPPDVSMIESLVTFESTTAAHFRVNNVQLNCGAPELCGITAIVSEPLDVFIDSVGEAWERGIAAYDSVVDADYFEGDTNNHVTWELVDTGEEGHDVVIETTFSNTGANGLTFIGGPADGSLDLSAYAQGALVFDARYISNPNDLPLVFKVDSTNFAGTGERDVGRWPLNEWKTFEVPVSVLVNQGLNLSEVTAFVLLPTYAGNDAVLQWDNVRFEPSTSGNETLVGLPVDFEDEEAFYNFANFEGGAADLIANPDQSGINTSATVVQMRKFGGSPGAVFGGSTFKLDVPIDFSASERVSMKVWASREVDLTVKLEKADEDVIITHDGSGWQELVFDYTGVTVAGEVDMTFIFDNGTAGNAQEFPDDWTFYVDDIALQTTGGTGGDGASGCDQCTDFDNPGITYNFIDFGNPTAPVTILAMDPLDSGNMVARTLKPLGAPGDAGTTLDSGRIVYPLSSEASKISVRVYSPAAGLPVRLKLEDATNPMRSVEAQVNTVTAGAWETLLFDFNDPVNGTPALNPTYTYDQLSIFFNYGVDGNTGGELTFLWDTIEFVGDGSAPGGISYNTNFEFNDPSGTVIGDGWTYFVNVLDGSGVFQYGYGPDAAPNGPQISALGTGEGGIEQGQQYLNVYSDYNNGDHASGFEINVLVFQERTLTQADGGDYRFSFQAKAPGTGGIEAPTTAQAFIKTLDPDNGFAVSSVAVVDMTLVSDTDWATYTVDIAVDAVALEGHLLQFGFENSATNYNDSGILYDNVEFGVVEAGAEISYVTDFQANNPAGATIGDGWTYFVNVLNGGVFQYGYGPDAAPNGPQISALGTGEGASEPGDQYLNVYSDYNNGDHANGFDITVLVFQERTLRQSDVGVYRLSFGAKAPSTGGIGGATTARAFIKTLDPDNGFSVSSEVYLDMTSVSNTDWADFSLELSIDGGVLGGHLLQFGFENSATLYEDSGIYYDNVSFGLAP